MRIIFAGAPLRLWPGGAGLMVLAALLSACSDSPTGPTARGRPGGPLAGTTIQVEGVTGTACQYGGEYPNCKSAPIDDGYNPNLPPSGGPSGTSAGGDGSSGGTNTGDDTEQPPPDTACKTGDPKLDSPEVQQGLANMWAASNPNLSQMDRREQAGWIVATGTGSYKIVPVTNLVSTPCSASFDLTSPQGAVALVHTHPYKIGEWVTACGPPSGVYYGGGSRTDQRTADALGMNGFVIDKNNIWEYGGTAYRIQRSYNRCGY
jgi:hypothetical protein